jgi:hypothetical protein
MSELGADLMLQIQAASHVIALAAVGAGIVLDLEELIRVGAFAGAAGAGAFIIYAIDLYLRISELPPARSAAPNRKTHP